MFNYLRPSPPVPFDFKMRLGECTGAAITMNVVDTACRIMREMASFEEAGVIKIRGYQIPKFQALEKMP